MTKTTDKPSCCQTKPRASGIRKGLLYGLLPHSFCIAFIILSALGAVGAAGFLRHYLLNAYFFPLLMAISVLMAIFSALLYLRQNHSLSWRGAKNHIRYLSILFLSVVGINLLLFLVVFPLAANVRLGKRAIGMEDQGRLSQVAVSVQIPCSGHAPLIIDELKKEPGIADVRFDLPNRFTVTYTPATSPEKIIATEMFQYFRATII